MIREHFQYRSTITTILADEPYHIQIAKEAMVGARQELERFIAEDPFFRVTFEPYFPASESRIVRRMTRAAAEAGVGPMAAVAGSIAWAGVEAMQQAGAVFGVIDNGGDIALLSDRVLKIGIHAGSSRYSNRIALRIPPQPEITGICTSSATVGYSISFGTADAVTVIAPDVSCADAWATSLCNRLAACDEGEIKRLLMGSSVTGVLCIAGDELCRFGDIPEIIRADFDDSLITAGI
jgi:ApbE superfamily uncharacterized protein (UPF0280 family)